MGRITDPEEALKQRERYVNAFNSEMVKIWKEQIIKTGAFNKGNLYKSFLMRHNKDGKILEIFTEWNFLDYGVYVDRGTGKEVYKNNPGDIGRDKKRKAKPWLSKKFYSSYMNIRDFFAENLAEEFCAAVPKIMGKTF